MSCVICLLILNSAFCERSRLISAKAQPSKAQFNIQCQIIECSKGCLLLASSHFHGTRNLAYGREPDDGQASGTHLHCPLYCTSRPAFPASFMPNKRANMACNGTEPRVQPCQVGLPPHTLLTKPNSTYFTLCIEASAIRACQHALQGGWMRCVFTDQYKWD